MGAYENPITTIDTESSKIIDNALNNVSASFQKAMYNKQELESKKIQQAQKQEIQDQNKINANYEIFVTNVSKSGTRSDAFYSMGYDLINRKFAANRAFQNANPGSEEKNEARNQVGILTKDLVLLTQGAGGIDEMNTETANIRNARNNNTPGGYYLGPKYDVGLDNVSFDDLSFEQKVARTMHERNAMFENKAGYKMNNGQLFGVDENNRAFNLETTDGREIPKIENWGESLRKDFDKLGIMKNGKMSEEYLNRKASATFTEGNITGTIIPTNMAAAAGDWSTELKKKAAGVVNSAQGWDDYATNNATYLSFAGKDAEDLEYDGDYLLTDKSKIKYTEAMVSFGLKKFLKQYEIEDINEVENYDEYLSDKDETYTSIEGKENFGARRVGEKTTPRPVDQSPIKAAEETQNVFTNAYDKKDFNFIKGLDVQGHEVVDVSTDGNKIKMIYDVGVPKMVTTTVDGVVQKQKQQDTREIVYNVNNPQQMKKLVRAYVDQTYKNKNVKAKRDDIVRSMTEFFKEMAQNNENTSNDVIRGGDLLQPQGTKRKYDKQ